MLIKRLCFTLFGVMLTVFLLTPAFAATSNFELGMGYLNDANDLELELIKISYFEQGSENFFPSKLELNLGDKRTDDFTQSFNDFNISLLKDLSFISLPGEHFLGIGFKSLDQTEITPDYRAEKKAYSFPIRLISQLPLYKNIQLNNDLIYYPYGNYSTTTDQDLEFAGSYSGYRLETGVEYSFSNNFSIFSNYSLGKDYYGADDSREIIIADFTDSQTGIVSGVKLNF